MACDACQSARARIAVIMVSSGCQTWPTSILISGGHYFNPRTRAGCDGFTMPDLTPQMPEIPAAPSVGGADIPGVGGSGGGDDSTGRSIKDNTGKTAENTKMIADSISMTDEEIKQLREMAERDVMVSWQQQTFNVHVNNDNTINNGADIDGMTSDIVNTLRRAMEMDREGVR